jgi:hypothetical protein
MVTDMPRTEDEIQAELNELDVPQLMVTDALQLVGDYLEVPVLDFLNRYQNEAGYKPPDFSAERLLLDLLDYAIESGTQVPHIIRALELDDEISNL